MSNDVSFYPTELLHKDALPVCHKLAQMEKSLFKTQLSICMGKKSAFSSSK